MNKMYKYEFGMVNGEKYHVTLKHNNIEALLELIGEIHDGFFTKTNCGAYIRYRDIVSVKIIDDKI